MRRVLVSAVRLGLLAVVFCASATAGMILLSSGSHTWDGTESLLNPRLFRNGVPSTWASPKPFPGTFACPTCVYFPFAISASTLAGFERIQIDVDVSSTGSHVLAYLDSFNPASLATNYLGDQGSSIDNFFQVIVPLGHDLMVVGQTNFGPTIGQSFSFTVSGETPEPATWLFLSSGLGIMVLMRRISRR
ncbi:MAG: PEP-CTERM sorting domain-containing protein [Acidobacteriota bacterium]